MKPGDAKPVLWPFPGGLQLADEKHISSERPIARLATPARLVLPLRQHIGAANQPLVSVGERVLKGQQIASAEGYISAPVHAPTSGTVAAIEEMPVAHPSQLPALCIAIDSDGAEEWVERQPLGDGYRDLAPLELRNLLRERGIVGLGGATFPTAVKLQPGPGRRIDTLIINGAECEPYISCDQLLMRERAADVVAGIAVIQHMVSPAQTLIGVEDNKPDAIDALQRALAEAGLNDTRVVSVPTRYPTGGEKQLIRVLTGKIVPSGGLPAEVGALCQNVGTCAAIADAVYRDQPLISRIVTVTGRGVAVPQNLEVPLGAPMAALIEHCGGYVDGVARLIMGGPMMGFALPGDELPVTKGCNCLLASLAEELAPPQAEQPCIRCGACVEACPAELLPQQLYWYARAGDLEQARQHHLFDCIDCGCCAYVCPSHIPLVQYYRHAKTAVAAAEREREKAEVARQRHEFRQQRIARAEREKAERLAKKKAALEASKRAAKAKAEASEASGEAAEAPRQDAIQAAIERARKKKAAAAAAGVVPKNVDDLSEAQRARIAAVEARRTHQREAAGEAAEQAGSDDAGDKRRSAGS